MIDLNGHRIVVTGAAGGIGRAMVDVLSGFGAFVVACDLEEAALSFDGVGEAQRFDLLDDSAIEAAVRRI